MKLPLKSPLTSILFVAALTLNSFLWANNAFSQSILLSNLKSSDQPGTSDPKTAKVERSAAAKTDDPFLQPEKSLLPPPRVSSILESADVDNTLLDSRNAKYAGGHEDLDALLWLRTSAEFDALTQQTFNAAIEKLGEALVDSTWNALVSGERPEVPSNLPPCVIVDVDETMLDNSIFQLELIQSDTQYTPEVWNAFVQRRSSPSIVGAVDFVDACRASGVKVFFVTNREAIVESATRDNLIAQGLMSESDPDRILSKNEQPNWSSDKTSRRRAVAQKYRVLLLIGDDLNDFVSAKNLTIGQRQQRFAANKSNWGKAWFVIPNPNYGNWEQATYDYQHNTSIQEKRQLKLQTLVK